MASDKCKFKEDGFEDVGLDIVDQFYGRGMPIIALSAESHFNDAVITMPNTTLPNMHSENMTTSSLLLELASRAWKLVDATSEILASFLGVTRPKYEMYIDENVDHEEEQEYLQARRGKILQMEAVVASNC